MRVWAALGLALIVAGCGRPDSDVAAPSDAAAATAPGAPTASATLTRVRARRRLKCGVSDDKPGFAVRGATGQWRGFDVDLCRAVAAAVLGDSRAVAFTALTSRTRFAALQSGAVDLVSGGGAWTFSHDTVLGNTFAGVSYYDGQGFMVRRQSAFGVIADLNGVKVCVVGGTTGQEGLAEAFKARGQAYQPLVKDTFEEALTAYRHGDCDALTDDRSVLIAARSRLDNPDAHRLLPGAIADEPMGLAVREGDDRWADIVRWTLNALVLAEDLGVTSADAESLRRTSANPAIRRLLGVDGDFGRRLGIGPEWSYRAIRQIGNYGEVFVRNLGPESPLKLERGPNALWTASPPGLLYAPPLR
jgi:general L-amino acid transport system substrate-binding protein